MRGPDALLGVASALNTIGTALQPSGSAPTPERRRQAIQLLEDDGDFSDDDMIRIGKIFRADISVADTFSSFRKKTLRSAYITDELSDLVNP